MLIKSYYLSILKSLKYLLLKRITSSPLFLKKLFLFIFEIISISFAVFSCFWILDDIVSPSTLESQIFLIILSSFFVLIIDNFTLQYKGLLRYLGSDFIYKLASRNIILIIIISLFNYYFNITFLPLKFLINFWILLTLYSGLIRFFLRNLLIKLNSNSNRKVSKVAIYGAGVAGAQLATSLKISGKYEVKTFIDDSPYLSNRELKGIPINSPEILKKIKKGDLDQIFIAIPSLQNTRRFEIINGLEKVGVPVLQVPSIEEITSGKARIDSLKPIEIEDLLGRDAIHPIKELLGPGIENSSICVTGAGGSIGSELCRQIIQLKPKKIFLFERNEHSLYKINQELIKKENESTQLFPVLGSATNETLVRNLFKNNNIDLVFHAAAYKHVPLVQLNPIEGLKNNIKSTRVICKSAQEANLKQVVLISTDKAVRPTNIMGASKRIAELIIQAFANQQKKFNTKIKFSMVRFGNVLDSSGSVVPLFRKQIENKGPITLTHPDIVRYFMTIPEAAQLVIQSTVLAKGGDVFLLDMGEPMKIKNLAEKMIFLSGLTSKNIDNPDGDIEIIYTGLRPGEKLFEELLINSKSLPTKHPLIFSAKEDSIPYEIISKKLDKLEIALEKQDLKISLKLLSDLVPEWKNNSKN